MEKKKQAFWELVQQAARDKGKMFFMDTGEGREFETDSLVGEDFSGWLVDLQEVEKFRVLWEKDEVTDKYLYSFAIWKKERDGIEINFEAFA